MKINAEASSKKGLYGHDQDRIFLHTLIEIESPFLLFGANALVTINPCLIETVLI